MVVAGGGVGGGGGRDESRKRGGNTDRGRREPEIPTVVSELNQIESYFKRQHRY